MPDWKAEIRKRMATLQLAPTREAAIVEELAQDLDDCYAALRSGGATEAEAYQQTLAELDDSDLLWRELQDDERPLEPLPLGTTGRSNLIAGLWQDLRFGARMLRKQPGFTLVVALTLALGVGANAAMFSVVRGVLLRPLVNRDEARLLYLRQSAPGIGVENITFSVPELNDLRTRMKTVIALGDFSTISFMMSGLGETRFVRAGVVGGSYFDVMGLRPVRGRLINASDDGPQAASVAVLTHRFWANALKSDPNVIGKTMRLRDRATTIIGILEPSIPWPEETEIIANVATSPHHMSATMMTGRAHRMTEVFARLAPGADLEAARAELRTVYDAIRQEHPEAYPPKSDFRVEAKLLRDQLTSRAQTVLLLLLGASALIFLIACSNVANLILARSVRREGELAIRAALGASTGALRRTLLAESLLLCGSGAILGVILALWVTPVLGRYASRFSVRAHDLTVDASVLWVGVGLALMAAVLLAFVPRLPSATAVSGSGLSNGSVRITSGTNRRLRLFAVMQIAASFVLLAGAGALLTTLIALQRTSPGFETRQVLAVNVPVMPDGRTPQQMGTFYQEMTRQIEQLPGVVRVALGGMRPWQGERNSGQFTVEGYARENGEEDPQARLRNVSSGFFATLGVPLIAGRDFNEGDQHEGERVVIISQSVAQRMFPSIEDALNRRLMLTDEVKLKFAGMSAEPRRIVGVAADIDDENIVPGPTQTIYMPLGEFGIAPQLFVHTSMENPYALVPPITRLIRQLSADQLIGKTATLDDLRADVLAPDRLNALVFGGFALVALMIATVGVAGVLAFSVSARTREFGIRLALGCQPWQLLKGVITDSAVIALIGVLAGAVCGFVLVRLAGSYFPSLKMPSVLPVILSAFVLLTAAVVASLLPAVRAARVDVNQALRSE